MTHINFDILPQRSAVMADHSTEILALIRAQAPEHPAQGEHKRLPLNLALVLDRSGSMSGRPLEEAKRCASYIIDRLDSRDRASLIIYDSRVDTLVPSTPVVDRTLFHQAIGSIHSGGMTALFDGWQEGARQVQRSADNSAESSADSRCLSRVLLLSDGCANQGLTDAQQIAERCAAMLEQGVSTSTYGLGSDFSEDLMVEMARSGSGQSYYGESAEDLMDPFQEEFSLMSALCVRQLKLSLSAPLGVQFEVLNDYRALGDCSWQMPDLAYGGEAWALVRLVVTADLPVDTLTGDLEVLRGFISYTDVETDIADTRSYALRLPRIAPEAWAAIALDERVTGRVQEVRVAQLQREVRAAALNRDWATVELLMQQAEAEAGNNAWVKAALQSLRRYASKRDSARMAKESMYMSRKMDSRLAELDELSVDYCREDEYRKPAFLRKKGEQGKRMGGPRDS